jgi:hypothetical protein
MKRESTLIPDLIPAVLLEQARKTLPWPTPFTEIVRWPSAQNLICVLLWNQNSEIGEKLAVIASEVESSNSWKIIIQNNGVSYSVSLVENVPMASQEQYRDLPELLGIDEARVYQIEFQGKKRHIVLFTTNSWSIRAYSGIDYLPKDAKILRRIMHLTFDKISYLSGLPREAIDLVMHWEIVTE